MAMHREWLGVGCGMRGGGGGCWRGLIWWNGGRLGRRGDLAWALAPFAVGFLLVFIGAFPPKRHLLQRHPGERRRRFSTAKLVIQRLAASSYRRSGFRDGFLLACVIRRPGRLRSGRFPRLPASESLSLCWPTHAVRMAKPARRAEDLQVRSKEKVTKEKWPQITSSEQHWGNKTVRIAYSNRQGTLLA